MKKTLLAMGLILAIGITPCYSANPWREGTGAETLKGTETVSDIDTKIFQNMTSPLENLLHDYRAGLVLEYDSTSQITVTAGQVTVENTGQTIRLMLSNSSNTTITWGDIDIGAEASGTTYYVYATAASSSAATITFKISTNSSTPSGETYWKNIGSFFNNSSSDIDKGTIRIEPYGNLTADVNGYIPTIDSGIKASINFNGEGTIAIRDSFNVSSITDNGTGDYTITWDTDFANANYAPSIAGGESASTPVIMIIREALTAGSMRIQALNIGGNPIDPLTVTVIVTGDQ